MDSHKSRPHLFGLLAGLFLAAGLCFAALVVARTWTAISESQVINVTGSARKDVRSDLVIWRAQFSVEAPTLLDAQKMLRADQEKVVAWLESNKAGTCTMRPVEIQEMTARTSKEEGANLQRVGYRLLQPIELRSPDVDGVPRLAGDTGALLEQGVVFESRDFDFIYTKAGEAKIEMMAAATADARARAEQIASQGGRGIKDLRAARMGVVQINPLHSTATSWDGNSDTSTVDKTMTVTVSATFSLK